MICWLQLTANGIMHNPYCYLLSSISSQASRSDQGKQGFFLESYYFRDSIALNASRSVIRHTWINDQDRYLAPKKGLR